MINDIKVSLEGYHTVNDLHKRDGKLFPRMAGARKKAITSFVREEMKDEAEMAIDEVLCRDVRLSKVI